MGGLRQLEPKIEYPAAAGHPLRPPLRPPPFPVPPEKKEVQEAAVFELRVFEEVKKYLGADEASAFEKLALPYLQAKPRMTEFPYDDIGKDLELVKEREEEAMKNNSLEQKLNYVRVKTFEALLSTIMELHWMPGAFITETSDYDDWKNGADAVLEWGAFKTVIDFTCQKDKGKLHEKLQRVFLKIDRGDMSSVKYFRSQADKRKHALIRLPVVIVGLSAATVRELLKLYVAGKKKELENHWAKSAIAEEILAQIKKFKEYINNEKRTGYNQTEAQKMSSSYSRLEIEISKMLDKKAPQEGEPEIADEEKQKRPDGVYQMLMVTMAAD